MIKLFSNYTEVIDLRKQLNFDKIIDTFIRIVNQYKMIDQTPRYFEKADLFLRMAEIQMIVAIGKNEGINVTKLAKFRGITKGAVSQMIKKLIKKGLVIKKISPETENEVTLRLTKKGKDIFEEQKKFNELLNEKIASILSKTPDEVVTHFMDLSLSLESLFKEIIEIRKNPLKFIKT